METISANQCQILLTQVLEGGRVPNQFSEKITEQVRDFHRQLPGYRPTELCALPALAAAWGLGGIYVKDESSRFGLQAFKALGGSYAVARLICQKLKVELSETPYSYLVSAEARRRLGKITLTTATDGNHGRGVAWAAEQLGQEAVVYMPKGAAPARVEAIRSHGARVEVTDLNYDDAVRLADRMAQENGWYLVQDTSWPGYEEIPLWIMQGYLTMIGEAIDQLADQGLQPSHVFIQAGVGAMAAATVGYLVNRFAKRPPRCIIIEPTAAACIYASALAGDGQARIVGGDLATIMAGLACGEPNLIGWPILRDFACGYARLADWVAANGMRILANPLDGDRPIIAGESGAVGIGLMDLLCNNQSFAEAGEALGFGPDSQILVLNTEGATDPVSYRKILWHGRYPAPADCR